MRNALLGAALVMEIAWPALAVGKKTHDSKTPRVGASSMRVSPRSGRTSIGGPKEALRALQQRVEVLERRGEDEALEELRSQAEKEAATGGDVVKQAEAEGNLEQKVFRGGQRSLQALNPEISVIGDIIGEGIFNRKGYASADDRSGWSLREVELHLQAAVDPFTVAKVFFSAEREGVGIEAAYLAWTSIVSGLSLKVGLFRQEFGVVNRWHRHSLDQVDYPLALQQIFGEEGLAQVGLSLRWLIPGLWAHANSLVVELTNSENEHIFSGQRFSLPSLLVKLKSYYDLSPAIYLEVGLSGIAGWNHRRGVDEQGTGTTIDEPRRNSWVWSVDWTLSWQPPRLAKYRNVVLRGELVGARKNLPGDDLITWGAYQYLQAKLSRSIEIGARFDWSKAFVVNNADKDIWGAQGYLTWWQSPWVRARLLYGWTRNRYQKGDDHRALLQMTFAVGPHKHERY